MQIYNAKHYIQYSDLFCIMCNTGCFKNTPKSLYMSKDKKQWKTLAWTHLLYTPLWFISCFTSAQCGHHQQHRQHQADMRNHPKCTLALCSQLC